MLEIAEPLLNSSGVSREPVVALDAVVVFAGGALALVGRFKRRAVLLGPSRNQISSQFELFRTFNTSEISKKVRPFEDKCSCLCSVLSTRRRLV